MKKPPAIGEPVLEALVVAAPVAQRELPLLPGRSLPLLHMTGTPQENLIGTVLVPADLISYQDGSVVSRMMVYKKSGTITLFAFDQGEGLSEHTAPYDAIVLLLEGEAEITVGGVLHPLVTGEMIIMPAQIPHALYAVTRFKMMLTMIHE